METVFFGPEVPYGEVCRRQEAAVAAILSGEGGEQLFFCEHTPVYTCGSSAKMADILAPGAIPVIPSGRGGKVTYHGPGQRVIYPILDLRERKRDVRLYIQLLQKWLVAALAEFDINAHVRDDVGVWVETSAGPEKIAAVGVRVRRWVAFHGVALNVAPNLEHFRGIVPCGLRTGVTSMEKLGVGTNLEAVDQILLQKFPQFLGVESFRKSA